MAEAKDVATDVTERTMVHLRALVREALLLLALLTVIVLGLPFLAGYLLGRSRPRPVATPP